MQWPLFRAAVVRGSQPVQLADACSLACSWLDLPRREIEPLVQNAITTVSAARTMQNALPLVRRRLWRDADLDRDDAATTAALLAALNEARANAAQRLLYSRIEATRLIGETLAARFPTESTAVTESTVVEDPGQALIARHLPALTAAIDATALGLATPDSIAALRLAMESLASQAGGSRGQPGRDGAWWMGLAWWALGRGLAELQQPSASLDAFQRAAAFYEQADDARSAGDCRRLASDLTLRLSADADTAAGQDIQDLLVHQEPMQRAQSLSRLLRTVGSSGDRFEAARIGEDLATILTAIGYPDPEHRFDAALERWIETAAVSSTSSNTTLVARLCESVECWAEILGARTSGRLESDPSGSMRAERALHGLAAFAAEIEKQAALAHQEVARRVALWAPDAPGASASTSRSDDSMRRLDNLAALDEALQGVRMACNEGASEALASSASQLRTRAERLASPTHVARALIEEAYVHLGLPVCLCERIRARAVPDGDQR